eukprot:gene26737-33140_t
MSWLALFVCIAASSREPGSTLLETETASVSEQHNYAHGVNHDWGWQGGGTQGKRLMRQRPTTATIYHPTPDISTSLDLRVVKAYVVTRTTSSKTGYYKLRISVVTRTAVNNTNNGLFTYSEQFRYRWTQLFLRSGLLTVKQ